MATPIDKINIGGTVLNITDTEVRNRVSALEQDTSCSDLSYRVGLLEQDTRVRDIVSGTVKVGDSAKLDGELPSSYVKMDELVTLIKHSMYKVGDIIFSVLATNPATEYGGVWVAWGVGKFVVGVDIAQPEFETVEKVGGVKTVILTTDQIPPHAHKSVNSPTGNLLSYVGTGGTVGLNIPGTHDVTGSEATANSGGGLEHNNLPPYQSCYIWKKTEEAI